MSTSFCLTLVSHGWLPLHQRSQSIQLQRVHIFKTTTTTTKSKQKPEREKKDPMIIQSQRLSTQNPELHGNAQWLWSAQIKHIYSVFKAKKISKWPLISGPTAFLLIKAKCFMRATFPKKAWDWKRSSLALPANSFLVSFLAVLNGCWCETRGVRKCPGDDIEVGRAAGPQTGQIPTLLFYKLCQFEQVP